MSLCICTGNRVVCTCTPEEAAVELLDLPPSYEVVEFDDETGEQVATYALNEDGALVAA